MTRTRLQLLSAHPQPPSMAWTTSDVPTPATPFLHGPGETYLRVVLTAQCPLRCSYCHKEGDEAGDQARGLPTEAWIGLLTALVQAGVRKLKFVGGEPLLRRDLPRIVSALRARDATLDLSVITSGVVDVERLQALFQAGLSRCNVSIHGFSPEALAQRGGAASHHAHRAATLDWLCARGAPSKLNYVYSGPEVEDDLQALLSWAAGRPVVVNVLDDLARPELGSAAVLDVLRRLRGAPTLEDIEPDPHSLPTRRLRWADGLVVEVKDQQLGALFPWSLCVTCPARVRCREGITALRLSHEGVLYPCMDRPDVGVPLGSLLSHGEPAVLAATHALLRDLRPSPLPARGEQLPRAAAHAPHP